MISNNSLKTFELKYVKSFGLLNLLPTGRGFKNPVDLMVGRDEHIFVLNRGESKSSRVGVMNFDEDYLYEFGLHGDDDGQFRMPTCLGMDSDERVYVSDEYNHRISIFERSGEYLGKWGVFGNKDGELDGPSGLVFDQDDNVYVVDQNNNRIQKFTSDGQYLFQWGEHGSENGQFNRPSDVDVDDEGRIYVSDWGNERVQVLTSDGNFMLKLRGEGTNSKWADEYLSASPKEKYERAQANLTPYLRPHLNTPFSLSSYREPYFLGPRSVTLDNSGRLYVTETGRDRVQIYER